MNIEVDWQIVDEDLPEPAEQPLPPVKPRRRLWRWWWVALALLLVVSVAGFAVYYQWMLRMRLNQVTEPVRAVARLEAQAIAANDRVSFLALQDLDDAAWRASQGEHFGELERVGLPKLGWQATGAQPSPGKISLQPGGVQLDVTYRFSVTQPMPGGPVSVTLQVPQFYKNAASGWVRARPGAEYWGPWRTLAGRRFAMRYVQRDASVLEGLIPRMDDMLDQVCSRLACPPQPIFVAFEISPDSLSRLADFSYGFDDSGFILRLVSPHVIGPPADVRSRDELYRVIGTRVVQALVYESSRRRLNMGYWASQEIVRWELTRAGLAGPFITPAITRALAGVLRTSVEQPLRTLPLQSSSIGMDAAPREALMPLALAFIEQRMGTGSVTRLIPAIPSSRTLGDAIRQALNVDPATLESDWQSYLRRQANSMQAEQLPPLEPSHSPPDGELALSCTAGGGNDSLIRIWADGTGLIQALDVPYLSQPAWSPDGGWLAFLQHERAFVMDAESQQIQAVREQDWYWPIGWLPDGRLQLGESAVGDDPRTRVVNLSTGMDIQITGTGPVWSPNGKWLARTVGMYTTWEGLLLSDADGKNSRRVASGHRPAWSPDSTRLAFEPDSAQIRQIPSDFGAGQGLPDGIAIAEIESSTVKVVARMSDLTGQRNGASGWIGDLCWSPNGTMLAAAINLSSSKPLLAILNADNGTTRAQWHGTLGGWKKIAWSSDNRHVAFWAEESNYQGVTPTVGILNVVTGDAAILPGRDFDWSPDGKWLAVAQMNGEAGVWLITPDRSFVRKLAGGMNCISVAWRPEGR